VFGSKTINKKNSKNNGFMKFFTADKKTNIKTNKAQVTVTSTHSLDHLIKIKTKVWSKNVLEKKTFFSH